jgi:hypothetical protein
MHEEPYEWPPAGPDDYQRKLAPVYGSSARTSDRGSGKATLEENRAAQGIG